MGRRKNPTPQVKPPAMTTTKAKAQSEEVEEALSQPQVLRPRPRTRSQILPHTENAALDDNGNGEHSATSSDPAIPNPAPLPAIPNPNRLETCASNTNQHPGNLHNTYTIKKRTKEEMVEACHIEVMEKGKRVEMASREAAKLDSAMKIIAKYEENLWRANIDYTPVACAGQGTLHQNAVLEATPMPQSRALRRTYPSLDIMAAADVALDESKDEDEEPAESEATNQNDDNYVKDKDKDDEEGDGEGEGMLTDDYIDTNSVKAVAKAGEKNKQEQRRMIKEIDHKVLDSKSDDTRPKKKTKDSTAA